MTQQARSSTEVVDARAVRVALAEIEGSAAFAHSARHRRFLRHLVEQQLSGKAHELREITLGVTVFGRPPDRFDPALDSIVRVEARRLRQRLRHYYAEEGRHAVLRISLPAGRYVPALTWAASPASPASLAGPPRVGVHVADVSSVSVDEPRRRFLSAFRAAIDSISGLQLVDATARGRAEAQVHVATEPDGSTIALRLGSGDSTAGGERHVLCNRFDGHTDALQQHVAHATLLLLRFGVVAGWPLLQASAVDGRRFVNTASRDLFDRARLAFRQRSLDGYRTALTLFESLAEREPQAVEAHTGIARSLLALAGMIALPVREALPRARVAAELGVSLAPDDGDARCVLAQVAFLFDHDWPAARTHFVLGLQRAPNHSGLYHAYAFALMLRAEFDSAAVAYDLAALLDPLDVQVRVQTGLLHYYRRDYATAIGHWKRLLEASPGNLIAVTLIGAAHLAAGSPAAAVASYEEALQRAPAHPIGWAGLAQARSLLGEHERADAALAELQRMATNCYVSPYLFAMVHARRGEIDLAFDWLERSATEPDFNFVCAGVDPTFDALRRDARWSKRCRQHGLPIVNAPSAR
ncbi:MAG: tetratricopeptide repeat protein [Burkholderiales bacterium]|nr:tetratricopeptide repeat protein [Burkholderiales bacterium]